MSVLPEALAHRTHWPVPGHRCLNDHVSSTFTTLPVLAEYSVNASFMVPGRPPFSLDSRTVAATILLPSSVRRAIGLSSTVAPTTGLLPSTGIDDWGH